MYDGRSIFTQKKAMIEQILKLEIAQCLSELYAVDEQNIQFQKTRKEFDGDLTLVVFPLLKISRKSPEVTAHEIGNYLLDHSKLASMLSKVF